MKRSPHTEDMVDHYWGSINYIFGLIKASEIKAGLLLSFYGIVFNFMFQRIVTIVEIVPDNTILYVLLGLWFSCTAISIFFCIQCFIPHIEEKYDKNISYGLQFSLIISTVVVLFYFIDPSTLNSIVESITKNIK